MFSWITTALLKLIWFLIIQGPLNLIAGIWKVITYLTGDIFFDTLFGSKPTSAAPWGDAFSHHIPTAFYGFWIFAAFMIIVVFLVQYFVLMFQDELNTKQRFMKTCKGTLKAAGITIVMPVAFFFGIWIMEFIQGFIFRVFNVGDNQLADLLYHVGDPKFSGSLDGMPTPSNYSAPDRIRDYNLIATIVGTWFMLYACAMVGMAVAGKVFELYCLFIIGPVFAATYTIDDGQRFKTWKDAVFGKMAVSVGTIMVFMVFITLLPILFKLANQNNTDGSSRFSTIERTILYLLFILGGGTFVQTFPTFFANFFGESAGLAEGRAAAANASAAKGMLASGALGVAGALGIGAASKNKMAAKAGLNLAAGGGMAGAAQAAGGAASAGGQVLRRGGLLGIGGKLIRGGSSLVGGLTGAGMAIGLGGGKRAHEFWHGAGEHIKNTAKSTWSKIKGNTYDHAMRHKTGDQKAMKQKRKEAWDKSMSNSINVGKSKREARKIARKDIKNRNFAREIKDEKE